jgi:hypothetical protein
LELARRWMSLIEEFTGGDPGIAQSMGRLWKEQGDSIVFQHAMKEDPRALFDYISLALEAVKGADSPPG